MDSFAWNAFASDAFFLLLHQNETCCLQIWTSWSLLKCKYPTFLLGEIAFLRKCFSVVLLPLAVRYLIDRGFWRSTMLYVCSLSFRKSIYNSNNATLFNLFSKVWMCIITLWKQLFIIAYIIGNISENILIMLMTILTVVNNNGNDKADHR